MRFRCIPFVWDNQIIHLGQPNIYFTQPLFYFGPLSLKETKPLIGSVYEMFGCLKKIGFSVYPENIIPVFLASFRFAFVTWYFHITRNSYFGSVGSSQSLDFLFSNMARYSFSEVFFDKLLIIGEPGQNLCSTDPSNPITQSTTWMWSISRYLIVI